MLSSLSTSPCFQVLAKSRPRMSLFRASYTSHGQDSTRHRLYSSSIIFLNTFGRSNTQRWRVCFAHVTQLIWGHLDPWQTLARQMSILKPVATSEYFTYVSPTSSYQTKVHIHSLKDKFRHPCARPWTPNSMKTHPRQSVSNRALLTLHLLRNQQLTFT